VPKKIAGFNLGPELATICRLKLLFCSSHHRVRMRIERLAILPTSWVSCNAQRRSSGGRAECAI
jgi:hypothetical protein